MYESGMKDRQDKRPTTIYLQGTSGKAESPILLIFWGIKVHLKISKNALKVAAMAQCLRS